MAGEFNTVSKCFLEMKNPYEAINQDQRRLFIRGHTDKILYQLNEDRQSGHLCDVIIRIQGNEFPAHRGVLAHGSGFFSGLFGSGMREKSQDTVELNSMNVEGMEEILSYIYTGEIELTLENAQQVVVTADFLLLQALRNSAVQFLTDVFKPMDHMHCTATYNFAIHFECADLAELAFPGTVKNFHMVLDSEEFLELSGKSLENILACYDRLTVDEEAVFKGIVRWTNYKEGRHEIFDKLFYYVHLSALSQEFLSSVVMKEELVISSDTCLKLVAIQNFDLVGATSQFLEIHLDNLEEILASDQLHISSEEVIFKAILKWINYKIEERKDFFFKLFSKVKLQSISSEFLQSCIENNDLVSSNPESCSLLEEHKNKTYDPLMIDNHHPRECLDNYSTGIIVLPTEDSVQNKLQAPLCYIPSQNKGYRFPCHMKDELLSIGHGIPLYYCGNLYLVQPFEYMKIVILKYDRGLEMWAKIGEIPYSRDQHGWVGSYGSGCLHGIIYIAGGLKVIGTGLEADVLPDNVVYGCDITAESIEKCCDISKVEHMNVRRANPCVLTDNDYLYVAGGYTDTSWYGFPERVYTNSMERYDPKKKAWELLSPMKKRSSLSGDYLSTLSNGKIFICQIRRNTHRYKSNSNLIEVYTIATDTWSEVPFIENCNRIKGFLFSCSGGLHHVSAAHGGFENEKTISLESACYSFQRMSWKKCSLMKTALCDLPKNCVHNFSLEGTVIRLAKNDLTHFEAI